MSSSCFTIHPAGHGLRGEITVPGDKSISHRAVMFGSLAEGTTRIRHFLQGADCLSTISCFRQMGVEIQRTSEEILVTGAGLHGLRAPERTLDAGNSGTTVRLLSGILAGQSFASVITGDASIQKRPMNRVITPLRRMGASIQSAGDNGCAPLSLSPADLQGIQYISPVASAQVKSCVLLAGLYARGETSVTEPALSRNHTELMLRAFGADLVSQELTCTIRPEPLLRAQEIDVPGDISSAAYFIAAALLVPGSELLIKNVGINPTRDGLLHVCRRMGGDITVENQRVSGGEPVADLLVRHSPLTGTRIEGEIIPTLIDELPVVAVLAACAQGESVIADAAELKVKESDRIAVMTEGLSRMGAKVTPTPDGMILEGDGALQGAFIDSYLDHRIAMSFAVAALAASGETKIKDADCVSISYPNFYSDLLSL